MQSLKYKAELLTAYQLYKICPILSIKMRHVLHLFEINFEGILLKLATFYTQAKLVDFALYFC